jgi:hypothetical protein
VHTLTDSAVMCFARTNQLLFDIHSTIRREMPLELYGRGCHIISTIGARILQKHGRTAEARLVALYKPSMNTWTPHYVVVADGEVIDFKRRVFVKSDMTLACPDIMPTEQDDGYYPDGRVYTMDPKPATFKMMRYKNEFFKFRKNMDRGTLLRGHEEVVDRIVCLC